MPIAEGYLWTYTDARSTGTECIGNRKLDFESKLNDMVMKRVQLHLWWRSHKRALYANKPWPSPSLPALRANTSTASSTRVHDQSNNETIKT